MKRRIRRLGMVLTLLGVAVIGYAAVVLLWRDPATDLYARYQQHRLSGELAQSFQEYRQLSRPAVDTSDPIADAAAVGVAARRFSQDVERGDAVGRIRIPRLGLNRIFVHGTRWGADLSRGPGHYERTALPGLGKVVAIAGHRTTFGAPLRYIDRMQPGDHVVVTMPYATFRYVVTGHRIVDNDDWSIIRPRQFETLVLSACHPLYSAAQRWVVFARLHEVEPATGGSYLVAAGRPVRAPA